jgi:hypothetical protein
MDFYQWYLGKKKINQIGIQNYDQKKYDCFKATLDDSKVVHDF